MNNRKNLFIHFIFIAFMCFFLFKGTISTMALFREKSDRVKTPALFPCAAKVKIPQLGSEETNFELKLSHKPAPSSVIFKSFQAPEPVQRSYLKRISADLSFSEDVVHDRCFHMVPYDRKYLFQALDPCKYYIIHSNEYRYKVIIVRYIFCIIFSYEHQLIVDQFLQ